MAEEVFLSNWKTGIYKCAKCGRRLFSSKDKFDAKAEWPAFRKAVANGVKTKLQYGAPIKTVKVHCTECDEHVGFLFDDGKTCGDTHPQAGARYSIFSKTLKFEEGRS